MRLRTGFDCGNNLTAVNDVSETGTMPLASKVLECVVCETCDDPVYDPSQQLGEEWEEAR